MLPLKRLQIALSPYRAVITSGNVPIPPGRRVQKASSDTQLGRRSAATRSTTSPVVPGGLCNVLAVCVECWITSGSCTCQLHGIKHLVQHVHLQLGGRIRQPWHTPMRQLHNYDGNACLRNLAQLSVSV